MADALIPYKECILAFGIQTAKGSAADAPTVAYPLPEGGGINPNRNLTFFHWADNNYAVSHYMSEGEWNEGTITLPIMPGYTLADDSTAVIYDWAFERLAAAYYFESQWATVWRCMGHVVEKYADCKVTGGSIRAAGGTFATVELNVTGIAAPTEPSAPEISVLTGDPYTFDNCTFSLDLGGAGSYSEDPYDTELVLNFDNHNVSPSDMLTLRASAYPYDLPCTEKAEWNGTMNRLWINSSVYADFKSGQEGAVRLVLSTGAVTATVAMPRTIYTEDPLTIPTEDILKEDSIAFQALGSTDGETDPISISEAA